MLIGTIEQVRNSIVTNVNIMLWSRLVGDARCTNPSSCGRPQLICPHYSRQLGRRFRMLDHRLLPPSRAHPGLWRLQKCIHKESWRVKHYWYHPPVRVPCLALGAVFPLKPFPIPTVNNDFSIVFGICLDAVLKMLWSVLVCSWNFELLLNVLPVICYGDSLVCSCA